MTITIDPRLRHQEAVQALLIALPDLAPDELAEAITAAATAISGADHADLFCAQLARNLAPALITHEEAARTVLREVRAVWNLDQHDAIRQAVEYAAECLRADGRRTR